MVSVELVGGDACLLQAVLDGLGGKPRVVFLSRISLFLNCCDDFSIVEKNRRALAIGLDVLVFPQGTRSRRLSRGHIGLAQVALATGATIVPVGCSGSDGVYTSRSFVAKPGAITYRVGEPMLPSEWADVAPSEPFVPFDRADEALHRDAFQAVVDRVMERIDGLVDEPYRFSDDRCSEGSQGADRFV